MRSKNIKKIAVVTGAGHRLGKTLAYFLARKGYSILLHYNSSANQAQELSELIKKEGVDVFLYKADLIDPMQIGNMWEFIKSLPFELEILINSAAIMIQSDIQSLSYSEFDETIGLNLRAPLFCSKEASKCMAPGGLIINISDIGAGKNWVRYPIYTISKSSLEVLTRLMAKALAPNIRVNAIAPGLVLPPDSGDEMAWEHLEAKVPLKRVAMLEEITSAVEFLLTNKYITGQVIAIDGGYSLL